MLLATFGTVDQQWEALDDLVTASPRHAASWCLRVLRETEDRRVWEAALQRLARTRTPRAFEEILRLVRERPQPPRGRGWYIMGRAYDEVMPQFGRVAVEPVTALLGHRDPAVRAAAAYILALVPRHSCRAARKLAACLQDSVDSVRVNASYALCELFRYCDLPVAPVARGLADPVVAVRLNCVAALRAMPAAPAVREALVASLEDGDEDLRFVARSTLASRFPE